MVNQSQEPAALEETLADLRDLYHNAPCGFHSLDATGKYVRVNATEAQWLGIPIEELVGRVRFQEVLTPRSAAAYLASVEGARSRWPIRDLALELKCRDGSTRPVVLHANPIRDGRGNPVLNRSVLIDRWVPASAEPPPSGRVDAVATTLRANARRAHDIGNALTMVLTGLEFLQGELHLSRTLQHVFAEAHEGAVRAADLCKQIVAATLEALPPE